MYFSKVRRRAPIFYISLPGKMYPDLVIRDTSADGGDAVMLISVGTIGNSN